MPNSFGSILKKCSDFVYKYFESSNDSGLMILITSAVGVGLSCLAQMGAIFLNKEYSNKEKAYMIPQELVEGIITVLSMAVISIPLKKMAQKYVSSGKLLTPQMKKYCEKYDLLKKCGGVKFNIEESVKLIKNNLQNSDVFANLNNLEKDVFLKEHNDMLRDILVTKDAVSAISTTVGGMLATATLTPILRNKQASMMQKDNLEKLEMHDKAVKNYKDAKKVINNYFFNPVDYGRGLKV